MRDINDNINNLEYLNDKVYQTFIYTDCANIEVLDNIKSQIPFIDFIIRNKNEWNIRYITILCVSNSIKEYSKIKDLVTDIQPGCNLKINNNSFIQWYNSKRL